MRKINKMALMGNKTNYLFLVLFSMGFLSTVFGQSKEDLKLGVGLHGVELSFNKRIHEKLYLEAYAGLGGGYDIWDGFSYTFDFEHLVPFTKGVVKWNYVDLDRKRNFVSLQAKYSFGDDAVYDLNRVLITEVNWGIERHFSKNLIFDLHVGLGHAKDFDNKESMLIPTIGFSLKYRLFSIKDRAKYN